MDMLTNKETKHLFLALSALWTVFLLLSEGLFWLAERTLSWGLLLLSLAAAGAAFAICCRYFRRQTDILEQAAAQIDACLAGDPNARIPCEEEGALYRLFHSVNSLAAVLNAHADNELREKEFLKNTISDISHQLKTPLAALNIYNGLLQDGSLEPSSVKEFAALSEQELDRMETLVQNLLKITRLDAGSIVIHKTKEDLSDLSQDVRLHFAYRAGQEGKTLLLSGPEKVFLPCDRDWLTEAMDNLVKNALDHTEQGAAIRIAWKTLPGAVQITVADNGHGIHPEDLPHIFKRFYRSRFSQDTQGIGLGLPLAKAIVEAHNGSIEVDSVPEKGTRFAMTFPIPTEL